MNTDPVTADQLPIELVGGGDCQLHYHRSDRTARQDFLHGLQTVTRERTVAAGETIQDSDDVVLCATGGTRTLPTARNGREYEIVMTGTSNVTVALSGTDTIYGATTVSMTAQGMALHFKAITGGWIII